MDLLAKPLPRAMVIFGAIALTGGAYFLSCGLHRVWWLVWLAPLPVLLLASKLRASQAFAVALAARALGGLNFWNYLRHVVELPLWLVLLTILIPAASLALAVIFFRGLLTNDRPWLAALAFPAFIVATEYILSLSQGTFLNTGYTQLRNLPILQFAAIAGLWGISFAVNLLPATIATVAALPGRSRLQGASAAAALYAALLIYGFVRLYNVPKAPESVLVGLVETHAGADIFPPDPPSTMAMYQGYAKEINSLAAQGAQIVILPEMTALIPDSASTKVDEWFEKAARDAHVQVLVGVLHVTDNGGYNEGRLYSASGELESVYRKHHLVPTWENRSTPGTEISVLPQPAGKIGIEICRDMDYPELARRYGKQQVGLLLVPAWDQGIGVDAYWHGHLSLMRAVENGFTMVRNAKVGLLTASDDRGRILAEMPTRSDGNFVSMLVNVPVRHDPTLYREWGDWFAFADLVALAVLLALWLLPNRGPARTSQQGVATA